MADQLVDYSLFNTGVLERPAYIRTQTMFPGRIYSTSSKVNSTFDSSATTSAGNSRPLYP